MNPPSLPQSNPSTPLPWKRILKIVLWIWGFTPVGIWMLWKEPALTRSQKFRVALYSLGSLVALAVIFMMYEIHSLKETLIAANAY